MFEWYLIIVLFNATHGTIQGPIKEGQQHCFDLAVEVERQGQSTNVPTKAFCAAMKKKERA
jgi:hypothetical protein